MFGYLQPPYRGDGGYYFQYSPVNVRNRAYQLPSETYRYSPINVDNLYLGKERNFIFDPTYIQNITRYNQDNFYYNPRYITNENNIYGSTFSYNPSYQHNKGYHVLPPVYGGHGHGYPPPKKFGWDW